MAMKIIRAYKASMDKLFGKHLFATNVVTCGTLLGVGDFFVQQIDISFICSKENKKKYDLARTGRMVIIGFILGPFNHVWYSMLDRVLKGNTATIVLKKIACDQAVAGPFFCTSFLFGTAIMEGQGTEGAIAEWKEKFLPIYMIDWAFWPAAQFFNFKFLPTKFRVAYVSTATLLWNSFLSFMKHNYGDKTGEETSEITETEMR